MTGEFGKGYEWFLGLLIVIAVIAIISLVEDGPFKPGNDYGILVLMIFIICLGFLLYEERRGEHRLLSLDLF